ncbi:hypothetical protein [Bacillus manliponensis]|uniref:hypothetical protein n=1 Tax=Bacillus manliponensis TaxID=574376 RepID=UPI0035185DF8
MRVTDEKREGFLDPILQMDRQKRQLCKWLGLNIPVESLAVISHHRTIVRQAGDDDLSGKVIHSANLLNKIEELEMRHKEELLSEHDLRQLAERIYGECVPLYVDVLKKYGIGVHELIKGVQCPKCLQRMNRLKAKWECTGCGFVSKYAHERAMKDYSLLIGRKVTNGDMREFLQIDSHDTVKRLLLGRGFRYSGATKNRVYELDFEELLNKL